MQSNLAQVNTKNKFVSDKQRRLDIKKDVAQELAAENERAAKELEEEKDKMEKDIENLKAYRDKYMVETSMFFIKRLRFIRVILY